MTDDFATVNKGCLQCRVEMMHSFQCLSSRLIMKDSGSFRIIDYKSDLNPREYYFPNRVLSMWSIIVLLCLEYDFAHIRVLWQNIGWSVIMHLFRCGSCSTFCKVKRRTYESGKHFKVPDRFFFLSPSAKGFMTSRHGKNEEISLNHIEKKTHSKPLLKWNSMGSIESRYV